MLEFKSNLSDDDKSKITQLLQNLKDVYSDFYLTRNKLRLFIKENPEILFDFLSKGDLIAYDENGIAVILGYSDNHPRKYLKVLFKDNKKAKDFLQCLNHVNESLYVKIKKNNPLRLILEQSGFEFFGDRGKEILLSRKRK